MKVAVMAALVLAVACRDKEKRSSIELPVPEEPTTTENRMIDDEIDKGPERPSSVTGIHMALVERLADVAVQAEKIVRDHASDCDATAAALAALAARSRADVAAAEAELLKLAVDPAASAYVEYRLEVERERGLAVIMLLEMCKDHTGVTSAVSEITPLLGAMNTAGLVPPGAASRSGARPPGVTDEQVAVIDEMGALFRQLSGSAETADGDCAAMAKAFQPISSKVKALAQRAEASQVDVADRTPADEWLGQYTAQTVDMKRFILAVGACQKDAAVKKALEGMNP